MQYKNLCGAIITPLSPIGSKCFSYHDLLYWLVLRGCFASSGGVPIVKAVTNI